MSRGFGDHRRPVVHVRICAEPVYDEMESAFQAIRDAMRRRYDCDREVQPSLSAVGENHSTGAEPGTRIPTPATLREEVESIVSAVGDELQLSERAGV